MTDDVDLSELDDILLESEEEISQTSQQQLKNVSNLCSEMQRLEDLKKRLEEKTSDVNAAIHKLSTEDIPSAMDQASLSSITLESGHVVKIEPFYTARLPKEDADGDRHEKAVAWLEEQGYDGFIKNLISCSFDRAKNDEAMTLLKVIAGAGFEATRTSDVHWKSMDKIFKTQLEAGEEFPMDLFSAYHGRKTKIK